jgi:aspartyl-tRNA(Asn)/glutamyl-tRNA(Gln) amidotransferase subunit B
VYFEAVASGQDAKQAAGWIVGELFALLNRTGLNITQSPINVAAMRELLSLLSDGTISGRIAKEIFADMAEGGGMPGEIVERKGLRQVSDTGALETAIDAVLAANLDKVEEYRSGKDKLFGFFVGQVMKNTGGKANPGVVNDLLKAKLEG